MRRPFENDDTVRTKFLFRPLQKLNFCNFTTTRRLLL